MSESNPTHEGRCTCGHVKYRMTDKPLFVHCCHCRWCQRETGSAFALNAMIETSKVELLKGDVEMVLTPSNSGAGQNMARCPSCRVALWSNYGGTSDVLRFVRVGTLEKPDLLPPDIHIFTMSKQPWVVIPEDATICEEFYDRKKEWPQESLARLEDLKARR